MINSRQKGAAGEREFCKLFYELSGIKLIRNLEQCRSGGYDIIPENEALFWPWAIEIKRYRSITEAQLTGFWKQAAQQANQAGKRPALAYRENNKSWLVVIDVGGVLTTLKLSDGVDVLAGKKELALVMKLGASNV